MTLLRRAPREVYRVYDEEEFWQLHAAAAEGECVHAGASTAAGQTLRRLAVSTVLLAVIGIVGVLSAIARAPSASRGGRRAGSRLLASTAPLVSAHAHIWRQGGSRQARPGRARVTAPGHKALIARVIATARELPSRQVAVSRRAVDASADTVAAAPVQAPVHPVMPNETQAPPAVASAVARAVAPGQSEFGFER
ncbi:MAG TPA: hypothetical protein VED41_09975 [Solirubrobacteraceae bacterium]|nr:hypothetical protein [Solirubrobacteraceae bacterium]